jgi:hypothetical protein
LGKKQSDIPLAEPDTTRVPRVVDCLTAGARLLPHHAANRPAMSSGVAVTLDPHGGGQ